MGGGGGGDPPGKPERAGGPTASLQNAYRDRHLATTQKDNASRRSGSKARSCWKKVWSPIKSSKHKGGYTCIQIAEFIFCFLGKGTVSKNHDGQCLRMLEGCGGGGHLLAGPRQCSLIIGTMLEQDHRKIIGKMP